MPAAHLTITRTPDGTKVLLNGADITHQLAQVTITITPDDTTTTLITHKRATLYLDLTDTTTPE